MSCLDFPMYLEYQTCFVFRDLLSYVLCFQCSDDALRVQTHGQNLLVVAAVPGLLVPLSLTPPSSRRVKLTQY